MLTQNKTIKQYVYFPRKIKDYFLTNKCNYDIYDLLSFRYKIQVYGGNIEIDSNTDTDTDNYTDSDTDTYNEDVVLDNENFIPDDIKSECELFVKNAVIHLLKKKRKTIDKNDFIELITKSIYSDFVISKFQKFIDKKDKKNKKDEKDEKEAIIKKCIHLSIHGENLKILRYFLEKYNSLFSQFELKLAVCKGSIPIITELLNNKIKPNEEIIFFAVKNQSHRKSKNGFTIGNEINDIPILKLLLEYGITQKDFVNLTKKFIYVEKFKKFGLKIDDDIKKACGDNLFFPYDEYIFSQEHYQALFSKLNITDIKQAIQKYNIIPDINSLMNACKADVINKNVINLLLDEYNIKPTPEIVYLAAKKSGDCMLMNMIKKMNNNNINDDDEEYKFDYDCFIETLYE